MQNVTGRGLCLFWPHLVSNGQGVCMYIGRNKIKRTEQAFLLEFDRPRLLSVVCVCMCVCARLHLDLEQCPWESGQTPNQSLPHQQSDRYEPWLLSLLCTEKENATRDGKKFVHRKVLHLFLFSHIFFTFCTIYGPHM